jgi:signal transduction histidine kinase
VGTSETLALAGGLGLSYVKDIVTLHKGSIELIEEVKQGTCFLIKLPLQWKA